MESVNFESKKNECVILKTYKGGKGNLLQNNLYKRILFVCLQFRKDEVEEEDDIPYKYGFFHMVFSLGAMYFAMLFISWELDNSAKK